MREVDAARERARDIVAQVSERLSDPRVRLPDPTSLDQGRPGIALLFAELGRADADLRSTAHAWLSEAAKQVRVSEKDGLYQGAAALALALHAAGPHDYENALDRLDGVVVDRVHDLVRDGRDRARSGVPGVRLGAYDLISGATGLGVYLLHRGTAPAELRALLSSLVEMAEPTRDRRGRRLPGWWTPDSPTPGQSTPYPRGHVNLGVAHGIAGPFSLLAQAWIKEVRVPGHADAITRLADGLMQWSPGAQQAGEWQGWPGIVIPDEADEWFRPPVRPQRPVWCYGTVGIARALQIAGVALSRPEWMSVAVDGLVTVLDNPALTDLITDPTLCHGWAGVLHVSWRVAHTSGDPRLRARLPAIAHAVMNHPAFDNAPDGLLTGRAGITLALHTFATDTEPLSGWDRCLALG
ncbi:lanthionine synthetase C family protein [Nocardiopsis sp. NPDC049922]|uniref:lanthionine synthetase C family protein n=1 Tax=Nocardiopsis sp. NPDC049922 TaxID=3155157 RepID=UPI0033E284EA